SGRLLDGREILLEARAKRDVDMKVPGLGYEADGIGLGREQRLEAGVVCERAAWPFRHAKGGKARMAERLSLGEQAGGGSGVARVASLDVVEAEHVEVVGDQPP